MRNFIKPKVALWMVFFFVFNLIGCGGGGGGGDKSADAELQDALISFNVTTEWVVDDMVDLKETVDQLKAVLAADDGSTEKAGKIGKLVERFGQDADAFLASVETMDLAEAEIQEILNSETSLDSVLITTIVGTGLVIYGLYSFGKKMKDLSDDASEVKKDRDAAIVDIANDVPGADEDLDTANTELNDILIEAETEFTTKVVSDLILSPANPSTTGGVIIKHIVGDKVQDKLKVISATEECEDGYDNPDCKIGVDETDDTGSAVVPDGKNIIVISSDDMARVVVEEEIPPGVYTEITIDPVKIKDAGDKLIDNDDGTTPGDDDTPAGPGDDDDTPIEPVMSLSSTVSAEDSSSVTYTVAAALAGVTDTTTVTISVTNAVTSGTTKTLSADGTVFWSVTVEDKDANITVVRSDTGEQQSLTLARKTFDGIYTGMIVVTEDTYGACEGGEVSVEVSGSSISGGGGILTGTITGNQVSMATDWWIFSGSIKNNVISGTWYDEEGWCNGTFSATKQ